MMDRICVQQRDYINAMKLHKITSLFLVKEKDRRYPLYHLLSSHEIYMKVGLWKELLLDFCEHAEENDPAYFMDDFYRSQCHEGDEESAQQIDMISESM